MKPFGTLDIQIFSPASFPSPRGSWLDSLDIAYSGNLASEPTAGFAASDSIRAQELSELLSKPVLAMASRGGYGCQRMLDFLKIPDTIRARVCGFSDLTVLLNYLYQNFNVPCIHGPMLQWPTSTTCDSLLFRSFENLVVREQSFDCDFNGNLLNCDFLQGRIIGGNLSVLCASFGTSYAPDLDSYLLFLEEINEPTYKVDRMLDQLSKQKNFSKLKGLIFGSFQNCEVSPSDSGDMKIHDLITDFCVRHKIAAVMGAPIGHLDDFVSLPLGSWVQFRPIGEDRIHWIIEACND